MVAKTRLNLGLYLHCLSCYNIILKSNRYYVLPQGQVPSFPSVKILLRACVIKHAFLKDSSTRTAYIKSGHQHDFCCNRSNTDQVFWNHQVPKKQITKCFFLSCKANISVKPATTGHGPQTSEIFVLFHVLFVLCNSVFCVCVNVYCTTATRWLPNCT
jgi:hypothetical protein